jgi:hypothetical protein
MSVPRTHQFRPQSLKEKGHATGDQKHKIVDYSASPSNSKIVLYHYPEANLASTDTEPPCYDN